ncbi:MAG: hypothetical protein ABJL72_04080 [Roseobacter sp.]
MAKRIARRAAPHDQQEAEALAAAWYFVLWTEMCSITPIRHLARRIHKRFGEQYILIPIEKKKIHCLNFWQKNDLEPIVLAYELWRRDANVFLYKKPKRNWLPNRKMRRLTLEFAVKSRFWGAKAPASTPTERANKIFAADHVRNPSFVADKIGQSLRLGKPAEKVEHGDVLLWGAQQVGPPLKVPFRQVEDGRDFQRFSPDVTPPDLIDGFLHLIGDLSHTAWGNAKNTVASTGLTEAHICDLLTFDSALIGHAVSDAGGHMRLWPHSTNAVILPAHDNKRISAVTAVTRTAERQWAQLLSKDSVDLVPEIMIPKPEATIAFQPDEPVHVIFFAGAHCQARMPVLDVNAHRETLRRLFTRLNDLPPNFKILVKSKTIWEKEEWLMQFFPEGNSFEFTKQTTAELQHPNMIFVTANFGSSALLEGMSQGIPGFVARDTPVMDYTALSEQGSQVGDVDFVFNQIRACGKEAYYTQVQESNLDWLRRETGIS